VPYGPWERIQQLFGSPVRLDRGKSRAAISIRPRCSGQFHSGPDDRSPAPGTALNPNQIAREHAEKLSVLLMGVEKVVGVNWFLYALAGSVVKPLPQGQAPLHLHANALREP